MSQSHSRVTVIFLEPKFNKTRGQVAWLFLSFSSVLASLPLGSRLYPANQHLYLGFTKSKLCGAQIRRKTHLKWPRLCLGSVSVQWWQQPHSRSSRCASRSSICFSLILGQSSTEDRQKMAQFTRNHRLHAFDKRTSLYVLLP